MKTTTRQWVFAVFVAAAVSWVTEAQQATNTAPATAAAAATHGPKIRFEESVHDFAKITGGQAVKHTFVFTNVGDQTLELSNVAPSCGCTTAGEWSRKVEPGKTGTIPIQFNSGSFSGDIHKNITVTSNDKSQPQTVLQIKGSIWKPIDVTPQYAVLTVVPESPSNAPAKIKILNNTDVPLTLSAPEASNRSLSVELAALKPGKEFELTVAALPPFKPGNLQGNITIKTSSTNMPVITVTAWANVQPVIAVTPQQIILPRPPLAGKVTHSISIQNHGTNQLSLSDPKLNVEGVEVELKEAVPGRTFTANVTFPQGFEIPTGKTVELTFTSNRPDNPLIKVPVMQTPALPVPVQSALPKAQPATPRRTIVPAPPPPLPPTSGNAAVAPRQPAAQ